MTVPVATELRLLVVLSGVTFLPGSALLALSGNWRRWQGLQRFFAAVGLSIAVYPILFYVARSLLPRAQLNSWVLMVLLLSALVVTAWGSWQHRVFLFLPNRLEWAALMLLGLTLASRMWFAHAHPFPAWSDSLHHTLLTELTAENGRLPRTLDPYFPNVLDMYHLGLYALSGTVQMVGRVPAHTALLWTAQFLNGLCGAGIYLVLDRQAGRTGAVVGLAVAGLFSAHPALWANWGRFTQLSGVVILPFAWAFFWEMLSSTGAPEQPDRNLRQRSWLILFASATSAAVFLLHFRVGIFYLLLLGITTLLTLWKNPSRENRLLMFRSLVGTGLGFLLIIMPTLWDAAGYYLAERAAPAAPLDPAESEQFLQNYYVFPLSTLPYLAAPVWLLLLSSLLGLAGLLARNILVLINLAWASLLVLIGNLYLLDIPALRLTNLGAVLIMLYLPISIVIGAGIEEGLHRLPQRGLVPVTAVLSAVVLVAGILATRTRATTIEPFRHFVTPQDMAAMRWIDQNVPQDATFAINTFFWLPRFAHGTDAGYWIPYLTRRDIVTSTMLVDGLPTDYWERAQTRFEAAEALETDLNALDTLYSLGVEYVYIGAKGDFSGPGLQLDYLTQSDAVTLLYSQGGTAVLKISPPGIAMNRSG